MALKSTHNNCIDFDELMSELSSQKKTYDQELKTTNVNGIFISNFAFLASKNSILAELGFLAEDNLEKDPVTSIEKIGQFGEFLARQIAKKNRVDLRNIEKQYKLVQNLKDDNLIDSKVYAHLNFIRLKRNDAVHYRKGNYQTALFCIQYAYEIGFWYDCKFGQKQQNIKHSFIIPSNLNKILSSQYEEAVAQLGAMITDYEFLNNRLLNSPNLMTDLQKEKQSIYVQVTKFKKISHPEYFNNKIKQKEKEIVSILSSIKLMMQKASKSNISLPPIPFFILYTLDRYNLYRF